VFAAFWAGQKGSLLFWAGILSLFGAMAQGLTSRRHAALLPYVAAVTNLVVAFFVITMLFAANPFERLLFTPEDGRGLNPQLQNPGMTIHPPMLYLGYISITIPFAFAVAALLTTLHDVALVAGWFALTGHEFDLTVLAGLLSVMGYSINDTIVIFDRIRESRGRGLRKGQTLAGLVNTSLNQTLSRTILTSFTTFMASVVLFLFGGEVLRDFAFALVVGVVLGTYSTVAAASLIVDWETWSRSRQGSPRKVPAKA